MDTSRREFVRIAGAASIGSLLHFPTLGAATVLKSRRPNDTLSFGVIGCNGMGFGNTRSMIKNENVQCIAVCDVDASVRQRRSNQLEEMTGIRPTEYTDYRKLLENPDLDFVVIGTPDHWHCLMTVDALEAGKHVYVEKPLANSIVECEIMLRAAKQHNLKLQVGQWQRSGPHWQHAVDFVRSGQLGNIRTVKAWAYQGWMKPIPVKPDSAVPEGVDYDMWLGPAAARPFNPNRFHFNFRWFWDYAGGLMTDWGVHIIDYALFGMDAGMPKSVMATGGKFAYPDDASETPDTLQTVYEFDGFTMLWEHATGIDLGPYRRTHGVAYIGNNGTLVVDRGGWEVIPETMTDSDTQERINKVAVPQPESQSGDDLDRHTTNFVQAIRNDETLLGGIDVGFKAATVAHLGNIAYKRGTKIYIDQDTRRVIDDAAANELMKPTYRAPWTLPNY